MGIERLKTLRGHRSQREMASEIGIPTSTYEAIENGRREGRKDTLIKIARFHGLTVDELFYESVGRVEKSLNNAKLHP